MCTSRPHTSVHTLYARCAIKQDCANLDEINHPNKKRNATRDRAPDGGDSRLARGAAARFTLLTVKRTNYLGAATRRTVDRYLKPVSVRSSTCRSGVTLLSLAHTALLSVCVCVCGGGLHDCYIDDSVGEAHDEFSRDARARDETCIN